MGLMKNLCNPEDQRLLEKLNKDVVLGPTLARPDPYIKFNIKKDWNMD